MSIKQNKLINHTKYYRAADTFKSPKMMRCDSDWIFEREVEVAIGWYSENL